ncbi:MAG: 30S ribosomal protein S10 [Candidatus Parvarchaeota archaeon]|jgi:small subunit ribosomal protein S10|nr:30S ribosomal protein S10 [Candidatus Parvarchaeota archaeon]MCL5101601.1 30S ribosomal protein S10 [Candidatus Parvarchaeota archaeon]
MQKARIKLTSTDALKLKKVCDDILDISKKLGTTVSGPIPVPTKKLKVTTRRAPAGAGRETYETWEMRLHKRIIDMQADPKALHLIMKTAVPKEVNIEMELIGY